MIMVRMWRRRRWLRRVEAARAWQNAQRAQAAEHDAAIARILGLAEPER